MHEQVVGIARVGMTEREFACEMSGRFTELKLGPEYAWNHGGYDDAGNPRNPEMDTMFKGVITNLSLIHI